MAHRTCKNTFALRYEGYYKGHTGQGEEKVPGTQGVGETIEHLSLLRGHHHSDTYMYTGRFLNVFLSICYFVFFK